ncbi:hypothetical protein HZC08_01085 [Candidatus Micrarchaeota archaeon]|nr:hypothetical protein [Candidatus Micrarchaeota archaeon]
MVKNVGKEVVDLLSKHPEGLDIDSIIKTLNSDIREVKPILVELQGQNKVSSGLKKISKQFNSFDRHYFLL